ncbi:MAG: hypothetical protein KC933_09720 [Myxococcales bacterium]|nr:hypothetical protein [Myxococcales bacterium]MCB9647147.1 hypothetical protein [Deltaproteobacteria bacterium]
MTRRLAAAALLALAACPGSGPEAPKIDALDPPAVEGGAPFTLRVTGERLGPAPKVRVGRAVLTGVLSPDGATVEVSVPALRRGAADVRVEADGVVSAPARLRVGNSPCVIRDPGPVTVVVGHPLRLLLSATDFDGDPVTLHVAGLPKGARWDPITHRLHFNPRADQGDRAFLVEVRATDGIQAVALPLLLDVVRSPPPMTVRAVQPNPAPGGLTFWLELEGEGLTSSAQVRLGDQALVTELSTGPEGQARLRARVPATGRGEHPLEVLSAGVVVHAQTLAVKNAPPMVRVPDDLEVDEETELVAHLEAWDLEQDPLRLTVTDLPPGARFDEATGRLTFRPDFIQGGRTYTLQAEARDHADVRVEPFTITVRDTIQPPPPEVTHEARMADHLQLTLRQRTDGFLDSPEQAGREFEARVVVPLDATVVHPKAVRIFLHGFGGEPYVGGKGDQFRIYPHDPDNTYWWGHKDGAGPNAHVPPYTVRRTLHLLAWLLDRYPGADPERVYVTGSSMGGAGAALMGLLWARHFALAEASLAQTVARNHRPSRVAQLSTLWGSPQENLRDELGLPVWNRLDLVRALADSPEARDQFIFTRHAKDDPIINFGAAVRPSPLAKEAWLPALERHRVGHLAVWDEGAHGPPDPVLGPDWWDGGWDRMEDAETTLARNQAFIAFSNSSADEDPGDGRGDGRPFDPEKGYAGEVGIPGDTGWDGAVAGVHNRYLRWDSRFIVDTWARFEVPLRVHMVPGPPPPRPGYPPKGDVYLGPLPIRADVTPRRVQAFRCRPGERIAWTYGDASGVVEAGPDGEVTVPQLPLHREWSPLTLTRAPP